MAFLKRITPYAIAAAVLLLAAFYVRVPRPLRKTPYEHLQTFSLYRADLPSVQATPYDYLMFVVQWPFAFCYIEKCYRAKNSLPNNFTIHGLWPTNKSGPWPTCRGKNFSRGKMREEKLLQTDLRASWPNLKCYNNMTFWEHEYNEHGRCCDNIFDQTEYFRTADKMWHKHNVKKMFEDAGYSPRNLYNLTELQDAVNKTTTKYPALRCHKYNDSNYLLLEVVICYNHNGTQVINCKPKLSKTCNGTGTILWKGPPKDV